MAPRTAIALVLTALLLGAGVYFFEREGERTLQREEASRALFPKVEPDAIDWIRLYTTDGRAARVERRDGRWQLVDPVRFPADSVALDGVASTLARLVFEEEVEAPQARAVYGLDDPERRLVLRAGYEQAELWIGDEAPTGGRSYVAVSDAPDARVFVLPTWRVNSLRKSLDDLRDRRVLPFDRAAVDRLEARWPGGRVVAVRSGGGWRLEVPVSGAADPATIDDLLSDLAFMRAEGFEDEPSAETLAELREPDFAVTLWAAEPAAAAATAKPAEDPSIVDAAEREDASSAVPDADARSGDALVAARPQWDFALGGFATRRLRYARGAHAETLYLLPAERIAELPRSVASYRSRELSQFDVDAAQGLELVFVAGPPEAEASASALAHGPPPEADPAGEAGTPELPDAAAEEGAPERASAGGEPRAPRSIYAMRGARGWAVAGQALDDARMDALLAELSRLEASGIVAEEMGQAELAALGLAPPRVVVRIYAAYPEEGPAPALGSFDLGRGDPVRGTFARRSDAKLVYVIDPEVAARLPADATRFLQEYAAEASPAD